MSKQGVVGWRTRVEGVPGRKEWLSTLPFRVPKCQRLTEATADPEQSCTSDGDESQNGSPRGVSEEKA